MFMRIREWILTHRLTSILIALIVVLVLRQADIVSVSPMSRSMSYGAQMAEPAMVQDSIGYMAKGGAMGIMPPVSRESVGPAADRMIATDTTISMTVADVRGTLSKLMGLASQAGGFMVSSSLDTPGEATSGTIILRLPSKDLTSTLARIRQLGIKVTSEYIQGIDVTDQYRDLDAQLAPLQTTYDELETIRQSAKTVEEKISVLQQMTSLRQQIDAIKGQKKYLSDTATYSRVTIYLSTDEYTLPYAPADGGWRPEATLKQAVRDLVITLRGYGEWAIRTVVYAVIWLPILIIGYLIYRRYLRSK